ncbi:MAG: ABC transporter permease [Acidaminobacteraceae bacterium]
MNFIESLKISLNAIWVNKMRSMLTMLGIIIGISSVIAVVALGNGSEAAIGKEFESIGVKRIYITTNYEKELQRKDYITHEDMNSLERVFKDKITALAQGVNTSGTVNNRTTKKEVSVNINGADTDSMDLLNVELLKGRFIVDADILSKTSVAIIDESLAIDIFGRKDVVSEKIVIDRGGSSFTYVVVGIYEMPKSSLNNAFGFTPPKNIYVPMTTLEKSLGIGDRIFGIDINLSNDADVDKAIEDMTMFLERRHKAVGSDNYIGFSAEQQLDIINNVLGILTAVVSAIAAISLLVGGIGVMNIMLVSVTERTREIGIRKALGARHKDILMQFLVESVIISGIGGIIGTLLGIGFSYGIAYMIKIPPSTDVKTVVIAWIFSAGVGVIFGLYPANKASKLDPIDALRYE